MRVPYKTEPIACTHHTLKCSTRKCLWWSMQCCAKVSRMDKEWTGCPILVFFFQVSRPSFLATLLLTVCHKTHFVLFVFFRGTCEKYLSSHSLTDIWTQTGLGTNKVIPKNVAYLSMVSSMLFVLFCFLRRKKKRRKLDKNRTISGKKGKKSRKDLTRTW